MDRNHSRILPNLIAPPLPQSVNKKQKAPANPTRGLALSSGITKIHASNSNYLSSPNEVRESKESLFDRTVLPSPTPQPTSLSADLGSSCRCSTVPSDRHLGFRPPLSFSLRNHPWVPHMPFQHVGSQVRSGSWVRHSSLPNQHLPWPRRPGARGATQPSPAPKHWGAQSKNEERRRRPTRPLSGVFPSGFLSVDSEVFLIQSSSLPSPCNKTPQLKPSTAKCDPHHINPCPTSLESPNFSGKLSVGQRPCGRIHLRCRHPC